MWSEGGGFYLPRWVQLLHSPSCIAPSETQLHLLPESSKLIALMELLQASSSLLLNTQATEARDTV